jgi:D-glycero-D-manno-heptose 1,7-bisphosphate phosphatase
LLLQIGERFGVQLASVHMVGASLGDLQTAQAAGCMPHLIRSDRLGPLDDGQLAGLVAQVPGTKVHASLSAFAEQLIQQERRAKADARGEAQAPITGPGDQT